jgi:hypothetical protein
MFVIARLTVLQHSETSRHNTTTSAWMVSPYKQHMNTQFSAINFINILCLNTDIKPLHSMFVNCFDVLCNMSFKERLPKHVGGNAVYTTVNLHSCMCTCWFCFSYCVRN